MENRKAQKYLLGVFEMLVGEKETLKAKVPHILKAFYDLDIVEEDALLEWADKVRGRGRGCVGEKGVKGVCVCVQVPKKKKELAKEIREKAAPLLNWLRTAEEESSSEDDDVEVLYTVGAIKMQMSYTTPKNYKIDAENLGETPLERVRVCCT